MLREAIFQQSAGYFLSPILPFLEDDDVTEVMVVTYDQIYIERDGRLHATEARFESEDALLSAVHNVAQWVGRTIDQQHPILDARLPDGSRVHAIIPPSARRGTCLTIRRFKRGGLSLVDLVGLDSLSPAAREFLELCVRLRKNILISGGTGSGKTSLLGALTAAIADGERIIVIEDTSELKLSQQHCVYLEVQRADRFGRGALTMRDLFVTSLRMRPDRIIMGEVRSGEALDLVQSMLSGHSGSLSTIHASVARDALVRLETLSLMSEVQIPVYVARAQVASAIDLIVQLQRLPADGSRRVTQIAEVGDLNADNQYRMRDLFRLRLGGQQADGKLVGSLDPTGKRPSFAREPLEHGMADQIESSAPLWEDPASGG